MSGSTGPSSSPGLSEGGLLRPAESIEGGLLRPARTTWVCDYLRTGAIDEGVSGIGHPRWGSLGCRQPSHSEPQPVVQKPDLHG
eukprot:5877235-Pyramimonas_sp.AAC.1